MCSVSCDQRWPRSCSKRRMRVACSKWSSGPGGVLGRLDAGAVGRFGRLDGLRVACGGCAHESGVGCGQADAGGGVRVIVRGGVGGAAVSLLGLGALAGAETRRRAGLPRASRARGAGSFGGRGRAIRPDWRVSQRIRDKEGMHAGRLLRVSKADGSQTLELQRDALLAARVDAGHLYDDHLGGWV
jgi:hypothetical protein